MNIVVVIVNALSAVYGLWFVIIGVLGSIKKYNLPKRTMPETKFAVVIPARNEEGVIGHLVRSLMNQNYPKEMYDIFVVPNGCSDNTELSARSAGASILACDIETHSKGDVLRFAFEKLESMGKYSAYCILDADNLAASGFLAAANDAMSAGYDIAQGYRDSKNPSDSWVAGDTSMFFWMMSRFYNRARSALNMSAALNGTGIIISSNLIKRLGWNVFTLTEDLEFSAMCAINGVKIGYIDNAIVYDEQPVSIIDSMVQRRRWFSGTIQCFKRYGLRLVKARSLHAADMLFVFGGCVIQILSLITPVYTIIMGNMRLNGLVLPSIIALIAAYCACAAFALFICACEKKLSSKRIPAILMFPIFLVTWFPANLWALITKPPKWKHIDHTRGVDVPD